MIFFKLVFENIIYYKKELKDPSFSKKTQKYFPKLKMDIYKCPKSVTPDLKSKKT